MGRVLQDRWAAVALIFLVFICLLAILAPVIATSNPDEQSLRSISKGPSWVHLLGTDRFGRDIFSRLLFGSRISLVAAIEGDVLCVMLGVPAGLIAGFFGGWIDEVLGRIFDSLQSMPGLILAFAIVGVLGPGITQAILALGVLFSPVFFRVARASASTLRAENFVIACETMGCSLIRTILSHILPNSAGPLLVQLSFTTGLVIVGEASLSFVGLGVQSPQSSWGTMINEAFQGLDRSIWPIFPPSLAVIATVLSFALVGDALRDSLGRSTRHAN